LNGIDDDGDSLIDCADSDCQPDYQCADLPNGWTAALVQTAAWSSPLPSSAQCANGQEPIRYFREPAGAPSCSACSCGTLAGATCGDTPISCAMDSPLCFLASPINVTTCTNFPAPSAISCILGDTPLAGGSCAASPATLQDPDPWQTVADTCPLTGGGCGAGKTCIPKQPAANEAACIAMAGGSVCPSGWPTKAKSYSDGTDTRSCGACACSADNVSCDADSFNLMTMANCIDFGPFPVFSGTSCTSYTPNTGTTWSIQRVPATNKAPSGSCTPSGGSATGSMTPLGETTMCCR
jgi:hypothetical protein